MHSGDSCWPGTEGSGQARRCGVQDRGLDVSVLRWAFPRGQSGEGRCWLQARGCRALLRDLAVAPGPEPREADSAHPARGDADPTRAPRLLAIRRLSVPPATRAPGLRHRASEPRVPATLPWDPRATACPQPVTLGPLSPEPPAGPWAGPPEPRTRSAADCPLLGSSTSGTS